jgi:tetratricopeptide (TPR) repeat protein
MTSIQHRLSRLAMRVAALGLLAQPAAVAQEAAAKGYIEEARQAESDGRYLDALAAYADAAAGTPNDPRVYEQRANLFMSLGHPDLASGDYRKAVRINPDDAVSQANLCWSLALANHDLDGALAACNAAVKREPSSYDALSKRGYVHLRRSAWAEAEKDFAASLALNSASPNEMFGHGLAMIHLGLEQDGRDEIASATLDSPGLVNEWAARGFGARGEIRPGYAGHHSERARHLDGGDEAVPEQGRRNLLWLLPQRMRPDPSTPQCSEFRFRPLRPCGPDLERGVPLRPDPWGGKADEGRGRRPRHPLCLRSRDYAGRGR